MTLQTFERSIAIFGALTVLPSITLSFMNATSKDVADLITKQNDAAARIGLSITPSPSATSSAMLPVPGLYDDLIEFSRRNAIIIYTADRLSIGRAHREIW